jgi:hypothetical protein
MPLRRRHFLQGSLATTAALAPGLTWAQDKWGASQGYPTGWAGGLNREPVFRVGNYSGGFEKMLPHRVMEASRSPVPFTEARRDNFSYRWGFFNKSVQAYLDQWPTTGLLICRGQDILVEQYRHARTPAMRLTSWSMAKSVTSLLLGICLDRKLIDSYDDLASKYVPELTGTLHGSTTLRNLSNMSSGAEVLHDRDNNTIYPSAFTTKTANVFRTVANWNQRRQEQGFVYNYNELCPLTLGIVIRKVMGMSMSEFAQQALWQPLGAEASATWTTDAERNEFNCIGFAATLRDWARLGNLVANRGQVAGEQVVSDAWITECTTWGPLDKQVRYGVAMPGRGYKAHMWHWKADGSRPFFNGHHGQRVIIDMPTKTVLVHTALEHEGNWQPELHEMIEAASRA